MWRWGRGEVKEVGGGEGGVEGRGVKREREWRGGVERGMGRRVEEVKEGTVKKCEERDINLPIATDFGFGN